MKKIILTVIAAAISYCIAYTQPCLPEGITFTTQEQIDNFQINYPGCIEIEGDVEINGDDITNLNGLNMVTSIWGSLTIGPSDYPSNGNPLLTSLAGLESLTSIGGDLILVYNSALNSLAGLVSLTSIGGNLTMGSAWYMYSGNPVLTSLAGLESLTSIGGGLDIWWSDSLSSLYGLANLTSIGEHISIQYNEALTSLAGLESLTSIPVDLWIDYNIALTSLAGLEGLTSIGGTLNISSNNSLNCLSGLESLVSIGGLGINGNNSMSNLTGLESLTSIGGGLGINGNNSMSNLTGLESLTSIGGVLYIYDNYSLTSLSGLESLTSIGGDLSIEFNDALTSLTGLENLTFIGGELSIRSNPSLSTCNLLVLCNYLLNPTGSINIYGNASGCDNPSEVAANCGFTMPCLPYGNYHFVNQSEIDNFNTNYPGCTELEGYVRIQGPFITNLNGLNVVTSIEGNLFIFYNDALTNLYGLESLDSIGGLINILNNDALTSLSGLDSLTSIGGDIWIRNNSALTNLSGLDNIDAGSISSLNIKYNEDLSTCDVQSICEYLAMPGAQVGIHDNAPGCNSEGEVQVHCLTDIDEQRIENELTIIPNPSNDKITISLPTITGNTQLSIFTISGQKVIERQLTDTETQIDISTLPRGVYFVRVKDEKMVEVGKMVKE